MADHIDSLLGDNEKVLVNVMIPVADHRARNKELLDPR